MTGQTRSVPEFGIADLLTLLTCWQARREARGDRRRDFTPWAYTNGRLEGYWTCSSGGFKVEYDIHDLIAKDMAGALTDDLYDDGYFAYGAAWDATAGEPRE